MIIQSKNFNIKQIADSGQCFRMNQIDDKTYSLIAYERYIELKQIDEYTVDISCNEQDYMDIWKEYFDLDYDYDKIVHTIIQGDDQFLKEAGAFGKGLRILSQEPFETLISFIISQNKNIPAIKSSIELLCTKFGIKGEVGGVIYYTFPTAKRLARVSLEELKEIKLGYRDKYVLNAAKIVAEGELNLNALKQMNHELAFKELIKIYGVGAKVANCVALYGLHHIQKVPVDVWIARIEKDIYNNKFDWTKYKDYAGIIQQYMFYYMRFGYKIIS